MMIQFEINFQINKIKKLINKVNKFYNQILYPKIYQITKMKSQNRRLLHEPMKSPSPDIANRSIITNTKSPANQIKQFIKMRQKSTSPKSLTTSFHQISKSFTNQNQQNKRLRKYIQDLQKKIDYLQKIRISHDQLTIINQRLSQQLQQLKFQVNNLKEKGATHSPHNLSPKSIKAPSPRAKGVSLVRNALQNVNPQTSNIQPPNDNILRQFNQRIVKMSQQNKRLQIKLKQNKDQKDLLELQMMRLKDEKHFTHLNQPEGVDIEALKRYFADQTDKIVKHYQRLNQGKTIQINSRMGKIQESFNKIAQKQYQVRSHYRTNSPHQLKANFSIDTNIRSDYQQYEPGTGLGNRYDMVQSKYTTSPSQVRAFTLDTSPVRAFQQQKFRIKSQNERLLRRISQLQIQLKRTIFSNTQLQKSLRLAEQKLRNIQHHKQPSQINKATIFYQQKSESLQGQLNHSLQQLKFKQIQIKDLQKRLDQSNSFIEQELLNYQKNIKQQKQKNKHYEKELKIFEDKIKIYEQRCRQLQLKNQQRQFNKYKQLQRDFNDIKDSYLSMQKNFQKYLEMALQIRQSITGEDVKKCLNQVQNRWEGYDELEIEIIKIHQSYESIIQNMKKNILEKDKKILEFQKTFQIMNETIKQLNNQKNQLQNAIAQYNRPVEGKLSYEQLKKRHYSVSKSKQKCQIRQYINRTVSKIGNLQKQIDVAIKSYQKPQMHKNMGYYNENRQSSEQKTPYYSGVKGDNGYRSTIRQHAKHTVSITNQEQQRNEHLDDPSLLQDENDGNYYTVQHQK